MKTVGDLAAHDLKQEMLIQVCGAQKDAIVEIVDHYNEVAKPKPWYAFWR